MSTAKRARLPWRLLRNRVGLAVDRQPHGIGIAEHDRERRLAAHGDVAARGAQAEQQALAARVGDFGPALLLERELERNRRGGRCLGVVAVVGGSEGRDGRQLTGLRLLPTGLGGRRSPRLADPRPAESARAAPRPVRRPAASAARRLRRPAASRSRACFEYPQAVPKLPPLHHQTASPTTSVSSTIAARIHDVIWRSSRSLIVRLG